MGNRLTLREVQLFSLEILKDVHSFCVSHNIKYSISEGSMIGAIRHQGFIPWDDDIDIIMPRPDYENFCRTYKSNRFHVMCLQNNPNYKLAFARVYDNEKTELVTRVPWCDESVGIWIDIFPADGASENLEEHVAAYTKNRKLWLMSCWVRYRIVDHVSNRFSFMKNVKIIIKQIICLRGKLACYIVRRVNNNAKSIPFGMTNYWTQMTCMGDDSKERHPIKSFETCVLKKFEDTEVFVLCGYDEVLRTKYGNYMQMPPEKDRIPKGTGVSFFIWRQNIN